MNVAEVAVRTGLSPHTIRYYDSKGLLPGIKRSIGGARQFTDADLAFLQFIIGLKKTGMSLENIAQFIEDGCILERLQAGEMPAGPVATRVTILQQHRKRLLDQQRQMEFLLSVVDDKLTFYEGYLAKQGKRQTESKKGATE